MCGMSPLRSLGGWPAHFYKHHAPPKLRVERLIFQLRQQYLKKPHSKVLRSPNTYALPDAVAVQRPEREGLFLIRSLCQLFQVWHVTKKHSVTLEDHSFAIGCEKKAGFILI
jgi:hypothetical protein